MPSACEWRFKVRRKGGHDELYVCAGFVEEMPDHGAWGDVGCAGASSCDGEFDDVHATVSLELLVGKERG